MTLILSAADGVSAAGGRPEEGEIHRLYHSILDRPPDDAGFDYWAAGRVEGVPLRAVADGFLNGREYARRFGAGSDPDFVDRVYRNVLDRAGDRPGVDYWLAQLADGLARTELVLLFSESPEHRARTGTTLAVLPDYRPVVSGVTVAELGSSWRPGCPVDPDRLRAVELDHVDFDGNHTRGTVVVNADVVDDVVAGTWSAHAYGRAIDINPVQNPYVGGQLVLPPAGRAHLDRTAYHPAMIRPGDVVTTAFADVGWRWGGAFFRLHDHQHFER